MAETNRSPIKSLEEYKKYRVYKEYERNRLIQEKLKKRPFFNIPDMLRSAFNNKTQEYRSKDTLDLDNRIYAQINGGKNESSDNKLIPTKLIPTNLIPTTAVPVMQPTNLYGTPPWGNQPIAQPNTGLPVPGWWQSTTSTTTAGEKETKEEKEARENQEFEKIKGTRGRLVAVVECRFGEDIKEGIIFIKYNGAYELHTYDGLICSSGSENSPAPDMKILYLIYDAELEKKIKGKKEKQKNRFDDLELV
jgi:hypothetical protein